MSFFLFLDDIRMPKDAYIYPRRDPNGKLLLSATLQEISGIPNGSWDIVRSYDEFVAMIEKKGLPDVVSFDHDLHEEHMNHYFAVTATSGVIEYGNLKIKTGKHCAEYFVDKWKKSSYTHKPKTFVHSANKWGAIEIKNILKTL